MGKRYRVRFTARSEEDLDEIFQYIAARLSAPDAAVSLLDEIEEQINRLCDFPYVGSAISDETLSARGYRKLTVKNYMIFYLVGEDERQVVIMRVLYGARRYERFLN